MLSNIEKTQKGTDIRLTSGRTVDLLRRAEVEGFKVTLVSGGLVNVAGGRKGAPIVQELKSAKAEILAVLKAREKALETAPDVERVVTNALPTPEGVLTPARCHEPGCDGRLYVSGYVRRCSVCGAEVRMWRDGQIRQIVGSKSPAVVITY